MLLGSPLLCCLFSKQQQPQKAYEPSVQELLPAQRYHKYSLPPSAIEANLKRANIAKPASTSGETILDSLLHTKRELKPYSNDFKLIENFD